MVSRRQLCKLLVGQEMVLRMVRLGRMCRKRIAPSVGMICQRKEKEMKLLPSLVLLE